AGDDQTCLESGDRYIPRCGPGLMAGQLRHWRQSDATPRRATWQCAATDCQIRHELLRHIRITRRLPPVKTTNLIRTFAHGRAFWLVVALLATLTLGLSILPRAVAAVHPDPVSAAWERTRAAGSYHFASDVIQETIPSATIANVGRSSRTDKLRLEGQADLRRSALELRLWQDGGSVLQDASGVGVKVEDGKTWVRQGAGEWQDAAGPTHNQAARGAFMASTAPTPHETPPAPA